MQYEKKSQHSTSGDGYPVGCRSGDASTCEGASGEVEAGQNHMDCGRLG